MKPKKFFVSVLFLLLASSFQLLTSLYAEDVKITTYYPSPYGSYKHLSLDDGASSTTSYGSLQINREETDHYGSHLAFLRSGSFPKIMGLGYKRNSDTFGFGPGVDTASGEFDPTYLSIDSSGNVGVGTSAPEQKLAVQGTLGILEGGANPFFHTIFRGSAQAGDITYTLPPDDGAASTVLTSNGSGVLTWTAPSGGPTFITPIVIFNSTDAQDWIAPTTAQLAGIPAGATAVILDVEAVSSAASTRLNFYVRVRRDAAAPAYILLRAYMNDHRLGWGGQGVFPITAARTFQFQVWPHGFGGPAGNDGVATGCTIRIIGYY